MFELTCQYVIYPKLLLYFNPDIIIVKYLIQ